MLAVVPQQTVGHGADQPLRPRGHLLPGQRAPEHRPVHGVGQDPGSVREVFHRVHSDAGALGEDPEQQPRVGYHFLDLAAIGGQHRQDVRNKVCHTVFAQVDAEVGEESPRNLQKVSALELLRSSGGLLRWFIPVTAFGERRVSAPSAQRRQQAGQLDVGEEEEFLQEEGECVQHGGGNEIRQKREEGAKMWTCVLSDYYASLCPPSLLSQDFSSFRVIWRLRRRRKRRLWRMAAEGDFNSPQAVVSQKSEVLRWIDDTPLYWESADDYICVQKLKVL